MSKSFFIGSYVFVCACVCHHGKQDCKIFEYFAFHWIRCLFGSILISRFQDFSNISLNAQWTARIHFTDRFADCPTTWSQIFIITMHERVSRSANERNWDGDKYLAHCSMNSISFNYELNLLFRSCILCLNTAPLSLYRWIQFGLKICAQILCPIDYNSYQEQEQTKGGEKKQRSTASFAKKNDAMSLCQKWNRRSQMLAHSFHKNKSQIK